MNINEVHWNFSDNGTKEPAKSRFWNFYNFWTAWNFLMRFSLLCSGEWALSFYMCVFIYIGVSLKLSPVNNSYNRIEPPHDKTSKMTVRPAKTQISLGIRQVWSESLLYIQWTVKDPMFFHADNEDWSDWADAQAESSLGAHSVCWFVMSRLNWIL